MHRLVSGRADMISTFSPDGPASGLAPRMDPPQNRMKDPPRDGFGGLEARTGGACLMFGAVDGPAPGPDETASGLGLGRCGDALMCPSTTDGCAWEPQEGPASGRFLWS